MTKPHVFYFASTERDIRSYPISEYVFDENGEVQDLRELNEEEKVRDFLSRPIHCGSRKFNIHYVPGRDFDYSLQVACFDDAESFTSGLLESEGGIDELVIHAHGLPLFIMGNESINHWPEDLKLTQLKQILQNQDHFLKYAITIENLRNWRNNGIGSEIKTKFNDKAFCTLVTCLSFANVGRCNKGIYPEFGTELAKFLQIPVIGSISTISETTGLQKGDLLLSSRAMVTAIPDPNNGSVYIAHDPICIPGFYKK